MKISGIVLAAQMIKYIASLEKRKYTYRFVFGPETIGILTYLSQGGRWRTLRERVKAGFVLSCVGDHETCSLCRAKKGSRLSDCSYATVPPFHVGCRCGMIFKAE